MGNLLNSKTLRFSEESTEIEISITLTLDTEANTFECKHYKELKYPTRSTFVNTFTGKYKCRNRDQVEKYKFEIASITYERSSDDVMLDVIPCCSGVIYPSIDHEGSPKARSAPAKRRKDERDELDFDVFSGLIEMHMESEVVEGVTLYLLCLSTCHVSEDRKLFIDRETRYLK